jgi:hypothetical protein
MGGAVCGACTAAPGRRRGGVGQVDSPWWARACLAQLLGGWSIRCCGRHQPGPYQAWPSFAWDTLDWPLMQTVGYLVNLESRAQHMLIVCL